MHLNFAVTKMKLNQVINLILNYHYLFPHLKTKTGTKKVAKTKAVKALPASIKLPNLLNQLRNLMSPAQLTRPISALRKS